MKLKKVCATEAARMVTAIRISNRSAGTKAVQKCGSAMSTGAMERRMNATLLG